MGDIRVGDTRVGELRLCSGDVRVGETRVGGLRLGDGRKSDGRPMVHDEESILRRARVGRPLRLVCDALVSSLLTYM